MLSYRMVACIGLATLLSGCSSSSNTQTGLFALPIQGLNYKTSSGSGLTDSQGRFHYKEGEDITFSLGDMEITTISARSRVSIEHWLGDSLPTNENQLLTVLDNQATHSEFHQQFNLLYFLANLDNDQDTSNGINVTQWQDKATFSINSNLQITQFALNELPGLLQQYNLNKINLGNFASHLFSLEGISFPFHLLTESKSDSNNDGVFNSQLIYEYNEEAQRTLYTNTDLTNGCVTREDSSEYDDNGKEVITKYINRRWNSNNETCDLIRLTKSEYAYHENGKQTRDYYTQDSNGDGNINLSTLKTQDYDSEGNLIKYQEQKDDDGDGNPDSITTTSYSFRNQGLEKDILITQDTNGDGELNSIYSETQYLDNNGNVIRKEIVRDEDNNPDTPVIKESYIYDYSEDNEYLGYTHLKDSDNDNIIDRRYKITYEYNADGLQISSHSETDYDGDNDGSTAADASSTSGNEYDESGKKIFNFDFYYSNPEKTSGNRQERSYDYDSNGNRTYYQTKSATNITGDWDRIYTYYNTYDNLGNVLTEREEKDNDGDGVTDSVQTTQYDRYRYDGENEYYLFQNLEQDSGSGEWTVITSQTEEISSYDDVTGNKTSSLYRTDNDGDNIFETEQLIEYSYTAMGDGIEFWFNEYID